MRSLTIGEFKANFAKIVETVKQGESFGVLYGKRRTPVAMLVPYHDPQDNLARPIGLYDGQVTIRFADDFEITEAELLGGE